jgi:hypothetical protein
MWVSLLRSLYNHAADQNPQHYTFYDFIVNKARGKSGPLFNFDVHDDVRMIADATIEKDEVRLFSFFDPFFTSWEVALMKSFDVMDRVMQEK